MEGFIIPSDIHTPENYQIISELMEGGSAWNQELVRSLFPSHVSNHILNTPIFEMEQERLIWTPSLTGGFTVKSTYNMLVKDRGPTGVTDGGKIWKLIWGTKLHRRHMLLLWKLTTNTLPTLERIKKFADGIDTNYYLCGQEDESIHHLVLDCSISRLMWWNSK